MEPLHKQEYRIRDLPTRSVTLFPTRAQVVREIKQVPLKPGANQITIVGLTPSVDEHSIKVEGTGSAIITDIATELLPNRDLFEDFYADSENESSEDEDDGDLNDADHERDSPELVIVRKEQVRMRDELKRAKELIASAERRLKMLDKHGDALDRKRGVDVEALLETYRAEREKVFEDHMKGHELERRLARNLGDLDKEETRLQKLQFKERSKSRRARAKAWAVKEKERAKKRHRKAERLREKNRIRAERQRFWPRSCYTVRITLEAAPVFTPSSSRRNSVSSVTELAKAQTAGAATTAEVASPNSPAPNDGGDADSATCDLLLSYVTSLAFWSPSYDLALSTTTNSALLCFDAKLTNTTCEAWTNCKIILSTSQTTFAGLNDTIPTLVPWRIKLAGKYHGGGLGRNEIVDSREERHQKSDYAATQQNQYNNAFKNRSELFGLGGSNAVPPPKRSAYPAAQAAGAFVASSIVPGAAGNAGAGGFGTTASRAFGAPLPLPPALQQSSVFGGGGVTRGGAFAGGDNPLPNVGGLFGSSAPASAPAPGGSGAGADLDGVPLALEEDALRSGLRDLDIDGATILPEPVPELAFQDSAFEETGLTTTYDLPGLKSLSPSSSSSKQRVARVTFASVVFSHTIVAKYRPAAYLRAKLRNMSKLTLLRGPAGLTLDGSFMGRTTLPRSAAGASFSLSLGIDPAITVSYPKPDVKRSTTGLFTKEDSSVYTRAITITNTRGSSTVAGTGAGGAAAKPVNLLVVDQVPVSEDEKLKIVVLHPRGLSLGGSAVATGAPGRSSNKDDKDWGRAAASLRQLGEVSWDVSLNAGKSMKLLLEYEVALPAGEHVVQV